MRKAIPLTLAGAAGAGVLAFTVMREAPPSVPPDQTAHSHPCVFFNGWFVPAVDSLGNLHYGQASNGPVSGAEICAPGGEHVIVQPKADGTVQLTIGPPIPVPTPTPSVPPSEPPTHECDPPCEGREECVAGVCVMPTPPTPSAPPTTQPTAPPSSPPPPTAPPTQQPPGVCTPAVSDAAPCGTNWPWLKPLPPPPTSTGKPQPGDPPGLMREGFGRDAKGGSGTGKIMVTVAIGTGPGSLPWAFAQRSTTARIIEVDESLRGKQITVDNLFVKGSYYTFDANGAILKASKQNTNVIGFGAGHDVIVTEMRCAGWFKGSNPTWRPQQNSGCGYIDGEVPPQACESWDPDCVSKTTAQRGMFENAIFDQNTYEGIQDDGLSIWGGGRRISFTRNFALRSFHLSTTGWKGTLTSEWLMRLWNTWMYNVATLIGERNLIYPREGAHWWDFFNNLVADWTWYQYEDYLTDKPWWNSPQGVRLSGMAPNENNMGWIEESCFLGTKLGMPVYNAQGAPVLVDPQDPSKGLKFDATKPNSHLSWGGAADNGGCDTAQVCAPNCDKWSGARNFPGCHPRMAKSHFFFRNNQGEAYEFYSPQPDGYKPPALPYPRVVRPWQQVLDEAGVQPETASEQAEKDRLLARITAGECKPLVMPPAPQ